LLEQEGNKHQSAHKTQVRAHFRLWSSGIMYSCRWTTMFQRNILPPSSGSIYNSIVITQKTIWILAAENTSNPNTPRQTDKHLWHNYIKLFIPWGPPQWFHSLLQTLDGTVINEFSLKWKENHRGWVGNIRDSFHDTVLAFQWINGGKLQTSSNQDTHPTTWSGSDVGKA
jgi:hypothetical protein